MNDAIAGQMGWRHEQLVSMTDEHSPRIKSSGVTSKAMTVSRIICASTQRRGERELYRQRIERERRLIRDLQGELDECAA